MALVTEYFENTDFCLCTACPAVVIDLRAANGVVYVEIDIDVQVFNFSLYIRRILQSVYVRRT